MNQLLLSLPSKQPHTACADARGLETHIGDFVQFDTAVQNEIANAMPSSSSCSRKGSETPMKRIVLPFTALLLAQLATLQAASPAHYFQSPAPFVLYQRS